MKRIILIFAVVLLVLSLYSQEKAEPKPPPYESWYDSLEMIHAKEQAAMEEQVEKEEAEKIKTWKLPIYMQENLQRELDDFNKRFNEKVEAYKKELKIRFEEFKDMPEDVVLYLEGGVFITRSDFKKLQEQTKDKPKEQIKKGGKEK